MDYYYYFSGTHRTQPTTLKRLFFLLILGLGMIPAYAQGTLNGEVVSGDDNSPLVGATVLIKGTSNGAYTDGAGKFSIQSSRPFPVLLYVSYIGYDTLNYEVTDISQKIRIVMERAPITLDEVNIFTSAYVERQKQSPISIESISVNGIKETPAANFYDALGLLKGVDLNSASIGFKVINTRGFNSSAPVRSLQIIDGVDNQAPGLNFSLGNFLGASEIDVEQVDLIVGASSAFYGPNAFNGVISMGSKNPFIHKGLTVMARVGERNMGEFSMRYARAFKNSEGDDKFAFKFNIYYLRADDWEADNLNPVDDSMVPANNPGNYDAVNRYGDENLNGGINNATSVNDLVINPGLGRWHRTGYEELDLVDYNTRNLKLSTALHYKLAENVELIAASNFGSGTTVLQGDNRYSLKDILFFQNRVEIRKNNKFFIRAYATNENAGNSYDAVFTAFRLQERVKDDITWSTDYRNYWAGLSASNPYYVPPVQGVNGLKGGMRGRVMALENFPRQVIPYDYDAANLILAANLDSLTAWHALARNYADNYQFPRLVPGTPEFQEAFDEITSTPINRGGTMLVDRSSLYHLHGEYKFSPKWAEITVGANTRVYTPVSEGAIFSDTLSYIWQTQPDGSRIKVDSSYNRIVNWEVGSYAGIQKKLADDNLTLNATLRMDKNQNFNIVPSYAASAVYNLNERDVIRISLSSAIRNPTLADQYLYYDVGRAILVGNLNGFNNLADTSSLRNYFESAPKDASLVNYFNIKPVQPEKVQTVEVGYRSMWFSKVYVDASYYFSRYKDFLGYNIGVDVRFSPSFPDILIAAQPYRVAANATDVVFTQGASLGLSYFIGSTKNYTLNGNYSWNRLSTQSNDPIIPAYNTPEHKFNVGISARNATILKIKDVGFSANYKWIQGFVFEGSPQFTGKIPTYDLLDVQINKKVPKIKTTFKLGASNVLNNKVYQLYGGPRVGRMAYFTILTELDTI
ncbi:MAG: carboxypeptidase-like regulatory domain-containing protein [Bacteroidia bacterium]|nr:carboxypeptidase-like regulatory domain-containing protein [Bacteroidia bacterium]